MRDKKLYENIYDRMRTKDTDELISIWQENDHGLWSDSAFGVIQKLLLERKVPLPTQEEVKVTVSSPPKFEIPWHIPYLAWLGISLPWVLFGLFITWVFLIHPFFFFTRFDGPLWPNIWIRMRAYELSDNIHLYGKLHAILLYIEYGIMPYGILIGYFILRKSEKSIAMIKIYLMQVFLFSIALLLFFNVVPWAIFYWDLNQSIFYLEQDWGNWTGNIHSYSSLGTGSPWGFFLATLKVYWLPIFASIIWYVWLIRSKWITTTFFTTSYLSKLNKKFTSHTH